MCQMTGPEQFMGSFQITYAGMDQNSVPDLGDTDIASYLNGQASTKRVKAKKLSLEDMNANDEESFLNTIDHNGRPVRASRGRNPQSLPGFVDSSNLVVDSSDGEDEFERNNYYDEESDSDAGSDSEDNKPHTIASPELGTILAPSTPPLSPLPPAVVPLQEELPFITGSNPFAGISPGQWAVQPLKIMINVPKGHEGRVVVNVDHHNIMTSMQRLVPHVDGKNADASVLAKNASSESKARPLEILIDIPKGHEGLVVSNIDFDRIIESIHPLDTPGCFPRNRFVYATTASSTIHHDTVAGTFSVTATKGLGFLSLSGEIRNRIYRLTMKGDNPVYFINGSNFEHSANLLRTCKLIHEEARALLYGENEFIFERDPQRCGEFWRPNRTEIGYSNVRRFLEMIGPFNIGLIRLIGLSFDDALPSTAPDKCHEERRYANDAHCLYMLKLLGKHGNLDRVNIGLYGRRKVSSVFDTHFVNALKAVPADVVNFKHPRTDSHRFQYLDGTKNTNRVKDSIREAMQNAKKIKLENIKALEERWKEEFAQ